MPQEPVGPAHLDPEAVANEILARHPEFTEVPTLEVDEDVPPRPEEEVASFARSERDA